MCFISNNAILQGTAIVFRIAYCSINGSGFSNNDLERLPSIKLGEIKWCRKIPDEKFEVFNIGVCYYPEPY
jgi:hypothetical protein